MGGEAAGPGAPRYKRPVSVLVVVSSADGQVLMLRRTQPADFWQSVTGSLRHGETPATAAARELREETGIAATPRATGRVNRFPILPAWRMRYDPAVTENEEHVFTLRLPEPVAVTLDPREHVACRWLAHAEAAALASSWSNRDAIRALEFPRGG